MVYYNMAWVIALAIPMAILVCTLMAFGRLSADNEIVALNIGHFLIGEAIFSGLESVVKRMRSLMNTARTNTR